MQTLSPTISPTISPNIKNNSARVTDAETDFLPAIAQSSILQTALSGLDASLNDELDRYRHWQENGQTISYLNPFRPRAVSTQSIWTSPSLSEALSPLTPPIEVNGNGDHRTIQMPVMPAMGSGLPVINISSAELHQYRGLDLDSLENPSNIKNPSNITSSNIDVNEPFGYAPNLNGYANAEIDPNTINAPMMGQVPALDDDEILQNFANDYSNNYANSYANSYVDQGSDAFNQENVSPVSTEKSVIRSLMNPVGIISLLLLLCSSAAIGYLMVDPSGVMKLFKPEQRAKSAQTNGANGDLGKDINLQNQQKANDGMPFIPLAGDKNQFNSIDNLAKDKAIAPPSFVNKNQLNNPSNKSSTLFAPNTAFVPSAPLRTVPSASFPSLSVAPLPSALAPLERSYTPAPAPRNEPVPSRAYNELSSSPAERGSPTNNASATRSPAASSNRNSSITNNSVAANAASNTPSVPADAASRGNTVVKYAAPLTTTTANSAPASSYRVVVENSYAASAQQIEKDAYVRPSDGQVQVGSYRDQNAAQQRIEQLRRQGIPARIE